MKHGTKWLLGGALAAGVIVAGAGMVGAAARTDTEAALRGTALQRASAAALAHTGGGTVIETELGDAGAAYGVEIRLDTGGVVEVSLDAQFKVIGQEADEDGSGDGDATSDN